MAKARLLAPERPDLAWLHIELCTKSPPCDPAPLEAMLRRIDPANAAGWYGELVRGLERQDEVAQDAALAGMAASDRFDVYWNPLVVAMTRAIAGSGHMTLHQAHGTAIGPLAGTAIPALAPVALNRSAALGRIEACRAIARAMQRGDGTIVEMIGYAIAVRVWPTDSPEWRSAIQARRATDYLLELQRQHGADWWYWLKRSWSDQVCRGRPAPSY